MLQIIGLLGCVYLVVKALEMSANRNLRAEDGLMYGTAIAGMVVAWAGAISFALWLVMAGAQMSNLMNGGSVSSYSNSAADGAALEAAADAAASDAASVAIDAAAAPTDAAR